MCEKGNSVADRVQTNLLLRDATQITVANYDS
jgi:hypothetical protein